MRVFTWFHSTGNFPTVGLVGKINVPRFWSFKQIQDCPSDVRSAAPTAKQIIRNKVSLQTENCGAVGSQAARSMGGERWSLCAPPHPPITPRPWDRPRCPLSSPPATPSPLPCWAFLMKDPWERWWWEVRRMRLESVDGVRSQDTRCHTLRRVRCAHGASRA